VRIDHLTVQNFDGFESREFTFNQHFNLLVGDNATGKTSVLDALSVAIGSWFLGIRGYESALGIDGAEVRVIAYPYQDRYSFEKQFPSKIVARGFVMGKNLTWERELSREGGRTTTAQAQSIRDTASDAERKVRSGEEVMLPLICTYGTERLWFEATHRKRKKPEELRTTLPSRLDGYRDCIDFTIQESSLLDWIRAEASAGEQRREETVAYRAVKAAIIGCVEGAKSLYYDERYRDLVVDMDLQGHQMFKNLSDGQRIVLTLIGDLVRRATTLNPQLGDNVLSKIPGVVLIDELDLHLHPKWQRHIIRDLRETFPSIQFIATTHSPQLVGEAQPEEVILLSDQGPLNPAQSFGMDSNWILKHVMGASERDVTIKAKLEEVEKLVDDLQIETAQAKVDELRSEIGNHPDLVRFAARVDRFAKKGQDTNEANH
jgi:predicted ATP-binding protein involved in virulence